MAQNPGFPWERSQSTAERGNRNESLRLQKLQTVFSAFQDSGAGSGLALDLLLHELAAEAQSLPFVTGSAIALREAGRHFVCRAAAGESAPGLGIRIEAQDGLSAECVRTRSEQVCHDTELDPRVDAAMCAALSIRSIAIVPLFSHQQLAGILEVFAPVPHAFDRSSMERLTNLGQRVVETVTFAQARLESRFAEPRPPAQPVEPRVAAPVSSTPVSATPVPKTMDAPVPPPAARTAPSVAAPAPVATPPPLPSPIVSQAREIPPVVFLAEPPKSRRNLGLALAALVTGLVAAVALLWLPSANPGSANSGSAAGEPTTSARVASDSIPATIPRAVTVAARAKPSPSSGHTPAVAKAEFPTRPKDADPAASSHSGGLVVYEKGKVVYRALPGSGQVIGPSSASPVAVGPVTSAAETEKLEDTTNAAPVAPAGNITGGKLIRQVLPTMPTEVAGLNLPKEVLLEGVVGKDGTVREIRLVRGDTRLSGAAIEAVQQWRYEPFRSNGEPVDMLSVLSVRFR